MSFRDRELQLERKSMLSSDGLIEDCFIRHKLIDINGRTRERRTENWKGKQYQE